MRNNLNDSTIELVDGVYNFDKKLFSEAIKEAVHDTYVSVDIEGILRFIRSQRYVNQVVLGYVVLFDKIPKDDSAILKLAYSIKETMKMPRLNSEEKSDLERLKSKLPKSVKNVVFAPEVCITNVRFNEYLYPVEAFDHDTRNVYTWVPSSGSNPPGSCSNDDQGMWEIRPYGDYVCITNVRFNEYLYAASDFYDQDRRIVHTWVPSSRNNPPGSCSNDGQGMWEIQPYGDYVCITNVYFNEYLYPTFGLHDEDRRNVRTWVPSSGSSLLGSCGNDDQGTWSIEDCSSIRRRRSIKESNGYNQTLVDYKSILTEENSQQIASRISAIVEDVERHTFLNQSKNKLDLDSYLNNRGRSNAADSMRRDVCSELNVSGRNIVLSGDDLCAITSGYETLDIENFPIQEVVINDDANGKKSLRRTLDLHQLVQQVSRDLSIKPIPTVIKDKSDLLIKLSISATGLQQDVITVRLKDALINKWYKKLRIIFDNAPVKIDDGLSLKPSLFISDESFIEVKPQDIEEKNKLIISKKAGQYDYLYDRYDLIVTNAFNADIEARELCIIRFKDFYKEPKMKTLSIKFDDKEILLGDEMGKIYGARSIDKLTDVKPIIDLQASSAPLEVTNSGDINARGELDRTRLHLASGEGKFDRVKFLLDKGADIEVQDEFGYTPIFLAIQSGKWSVVELLLDRGANIDAQDKEDKTLLHFAASGSNLDVIQFLLDRGANIEVQDKLGWTPILYASQSDKWDVVKLLISNGAKFNNEITYQGTPLHFAVQEGNLDMVRFLLDEGADIESQDKDNKKPLHLAVEACRLNVVKLLLDRGASVNRLLSKLSEGV